MLQFKNNEFCPAGLPANGEKITACYVRLSHEDLQGGDSNSVVNQRDLLLKYCIEHHCQRQ